MDYKEKVIALLNSQELSKEQKEKLENIFPELKPSEDEQIKKDIISYLRNEKIVKKYISDIEVDKWITWLEKQGEQTHAKLGQSEVTKTSDQESPDKVEPKDAHPDIDVRTMAAWQCGYKEAIEKACEWLDENMNDVGIRFMRGDEIKDIVDLFRKAMKGE